MREDSESAPAVPDGYVDIPFVVEPNYAGWRLDR
ncbi:MAG: RluA family pseudouridine synthase, partial [Myxococcaceae bacterium]